MKTLILILLAWFLVSVLFAIWWGRLQTINKKMDREMNRMFEDMKNASASKI